MTLISLLIIVIVFGLIYYVIQLVLPEPFRKVALAILLVILVLVLVGEVHVPIINLK